MMKKSTFGSLFAGIGGFDLGLERAGFECLWQVEKDPYCLKVLEKHWPDVKRYEDIRDVKNPGSVDLVCGGFPCQPFSCAGKRGGSDDDRYLWPEMLRVIREVRPAWVIGENVAGIISMALDDVLAQMENEGYACQAFIIPACAVDAQHRRDRVWIVAHCKGGGPQGGEKTGCCNGSRQKGFYHESCRDGFGCQRRTMANPICERLEKREGVSRDIGQEQPPIKRIRSDVSNAEGRQGQCRQSWEDAPGHAVWQPEPDVGRVANGIPHRVDRLRALGNAVVPQIPEILGRMILECLKNP